VGDEGGIRASHCRGAIRHAREFMQKWIDEHPDYLEGKLSEGELVVKWDGLIAEDEEEEEEESVMVDRESELQSMEDWQYALAMDELLELSQAAEGLEEDEKTGSLLNRSSSLPPPSLLAQSNPLGSMRLVFDNV
jgi:hypothetical protein